jgi:hypothetical protein
MDPNFWESFLAKFSPIIVALKAQIPIEITYGKIGSPATPSPIPTPNASRLVAKEMIKILVKP